jgi:hypothetical protein
MRTRWPWACLLLAVAASVGADEPAYTIKIKTWPDEGQSVLCRESEKQVGLIRMLDANGQMVREDRPVEEKEEVFTLTVLEAGDRVPRRYRESYSKAASSIVKNKVRFYEGASIDYNLRGKKYRLELPEKHNIPEIEQELLLARANSEIEAPMDEVFIPTKPVKVGASWKVSPLLLLRSFGAHGKLDQKQTEGTGTLVKVYRKDGKRFGVIEIDLTVAYVAMDNAQFDPPALFTIKGTLDTDIDGTSNVGVLDMTTRLKGRAKVDREGVKLKLEILREGTTRKERGIPK